MHLGLPSFIGESGSDPQMYGDRNILLAGLIHGGVTPGTI
jgi:hypothetical protein